jgi:hypothetical protein
MDDWDGLGLLVHIENLKTFPGALKCEGRQLGPRETGDLPTHRHQEFHFWQLLIFRSIRQLFSKQQIPLLNVRHFEPSDTR